MGTQVLERVVKECITTDVIFEERPKESKAASQEMMCGERVSGRGSGLLALACT